MQIPDMALVRAPLVTSVIVSARHPKMEATARRCSHFLVVKMQSNSRFWSSTAGLFWKRRPLCFGSKTGLTTSAGGIQRRRIIKITYHPPFFGLSDNLVAKMRTTTVQKMIALVDLVQVQFFNLVHAEHHMERITHAVNWNTLGMPRQLHPRSTIQIMAQTKLGTGIQTLNEREQILGQIGYFAEVNFCFNTRLTRISKFEIRRRFALNLGWSPAACSM